MNKKNHIKLVNNLQATIGRTQKTTFELSTSHLKGKSIYYRRFTNGGHSLQIFDVSQYTWPLREN